MRAGEIVAIGAPNELGGRDARPAEIRFELPDGCTLEQLPEVPALERRAEGRQVLIRTGQTVRATAQITAWALEHHLELAQFSVTQPTLEDVYLELTGEHVANERDQIEALRR
jgi:ABC-2 type transport system ATP-binding protein